jgi:hypothetical protein
MKFLSQEFVQNKSGSFHTQSGCDRGNNHFSGMLCAAGRPAVTIITTCTGWKDEMLSKWVSS